MRYQNQGHGVFSTQLYPGVQCTPMVARAKRSRNWCPATVNVGTVVNPRGAIRPSARTALVLDRIHVPELYDNFENKLRSTIRPLIRRTWKVDLPDYDGTQLIRYKTGGHYVCHQDCDDLEYADRYFTVLCYLNDDFQGGGTYLPSLRQTVTPQPGKTLIFPSRYSHAALPVEAGEKFVFLTWMCGPLPIRWI